MGKFRRNVSTLQRCTWLTWKTKQNSNLFQNNRTYKVTKTVIHSLEHFLTVSTQIPNLADYVDVAYVDGVEMFYYDSKSGKLEARNDWVKEAMADEPDFWEMRTVAAARRAMFSKAMLEIVRKAFNQSEGVHYGQVRFGCEWNDETDAVAGFEQWRYETGDDIVVDMNTFTGITESQVAVAVKHILDLFKIERETRKYYYTEFCPSLLKKFVNYSRRNLMRTELPKVSLLQKTPSSPITCHATGFYPDVADLFWRKDGEQLHEDVDYGPTLPNHDGTFQMTADLKAEVTAEREGQYECVFRLAGVKDELVTKLERRNILSNIRIEEEEMRKKIVAIVVPLAVLALVVLIVAIVIVKCHKRQPDDYAPFSVELSENFKR
ncbi:major histocompatibility complex class I-related protein 1-like isoform X3 [Festucalex cinctus]